MKKRLVLQKKAFNSEHGSKRSDGQVMQTHSWQKSLSIYPMAFMATCYIVAVVQVWVRRWRGPEENQTPKEEKESRHHWVRHIKEAMTLSHLPIPPPQIQNSGLFLPLQSVKSVHVSTTTTSWTDHHHLSLGLL